MMEALIEIQQDDGGWSPFWTEASSPTYTVLAVKSLALTGLLERKDLKPHVQAFKDFAC